METNLPEKYINTKVTAGFFLLLIVAVLAFGFNYFSVVKHLINQPSDDPLGVRLVLLNELVFKIQEADRAARIYTLTGLQSDYRKHEAYNDSINTIFNRLEDVFSDSLFIKKIDTLRVLYDQKKQQTRQLFDLSEINRYRQRYGEVLSILPDSLNYQISQITYSRLNVDSISTKNSTDSEDQLTFFGRIARFLTGSGTKEEAPEVTPKSPRISQIIDSSLITRKRKDPALEKIREQLKVIEEQDKRFFNLLLAREQSLISLGDKLTGTIRQIILQLQEEAVIESSRYQKSLIGMRHDLINKLVFLGLSALIIITVFVLWINRDLRKSRRLKEQLVQSREKIESLMKVKERFLADMSHEIRTPLTSIIGFSELLKPDSHSAQIIHSSAHHLLTLVNDILDNSRLNEGKLNLHNESITPEHLIREVWESFRQKAGQKGLTFTYAVDENMPVFIGDKTRLRQILFNLVGNAVKFTEEGKVSISLEKDNDEILCKVADTGPGISDTNPATIFEEFSRPGPASQKEKSGTGLGLAISKKLVEAMNGTIDFRNNQDKGCTFWFRVPLIPAQNTGKNTETEPVFPPQSTGILVVDDDPLIVQLLEGFMQNSAQIKGTDNPEKALKIIEKENFDLIITDYRMPAANGIEFIKEIRKKSTVPVILLSAAANQKVIEETGRFENVTFLPKPFSRNDLLNSIESLKKTVITAPENTGCKINPVHSLFDLTEILNFTGDDKEFFSSVVSSFVNDTRKNIKILTGLIRKKEYGNIPEHAHKMLTGFRQFGIKEGVTILKGIEIMGKKQGYASQLKMALKRLKKLWRQVEHQMKELQE
ncbi:MAG: hypothetical protein PWQ06_2614 [Anaerophaga sp.]|nr:hypothetical protein [Anaerophaga sp.]